jgi:hypothetical protein
MQHTVNGSIPESIRTLIFLNNTAYGRLSIQVTYHKLTTQVNDPQEQHQKL